MNCKLLCSLLVVSAIQIANSQIIPGQINWNGNWAHQCDFKNNDLTNVRSKGEECYSRCESTSGCTHFTWNEYNGGTCWMKHGAVTKADAFLTNDPVSVCGIVREDTSEQLKKGPLLWSDEFNSIGETNSKWNQETGGHGWGNNELQYYTNNNHNIQVNGGFLTIQTRKEQYGLNRFTSARMYSSRNFKYGVFEMRAKLPQGRGSWPAFWLLAVKNPFSWPADGEIDIMEHVGYDMNVVHATIHCSAYNHLIGTQIGRSMRVENVASTFHLYQLEWSANTIKAYIDGRFYFKYDRPANSNYNNWPFDNEFRIILNTAVGGNWGGANGVDENIWPQEYVIDYVRQYALA